MFKGNFIWLMAGYLGAKWLGQKRDCKLNRKRYPMLRDKVEPLF